MSSSTLFAPPPWYAQPTERPSPRHMHRRPLLTPYIVTAPPLLNAQVTQRRTHTQAHAQEAFDALDRDRSSTLDYDQLPMLFTQLHTRVSRAAVRTLALLVFLNDANPGGRVSLSGLVWSVYLVWSGLVWSFYLVWSGLVWSFYLVWSGLFIWFGLDWSGLIWSGLVWSGLAWSGLDWSGLVWSGLFIWSGLVWSVYLVCAGLVWSGLVFSGLVWSGLVWSGLVWSGLVWSGLGQVRSGLERCTPRGPGTCVLLVSVHRCVFREVSIGCLMMLHFVLQGRLML